MSAARHRVQEIGILRFTEDYGPRPDVKVCLLPKWIFLLMAVEILFFSDIERGDERPGLEF